MLKPSWALGARTGPTRNYQNLTLFACEGLICIIDERPGPNEGECSVVTPTELEHRVASVDRPYRGQGRMDIPKHLRQEYDDKKKGSQDATECIKEARFMGDPSDPQVQAFWSNHRRSSTVRIKFSAGCDIAGYPSLPPLDRGPVTGRTAPNGEALPTLKINPVPEHHVHQPPRPRRQKLILID